MRVRALGTLAFALVFPLSAAAWAGEWEKIDEESGVKVYSREIEDSSLVAFKGEMTMSSSLGRILAVLADNNHRKEWIDRLEESTVLERSGPYEYVVYQHFSLPVPISDRDYVYRGRAVKGPGGSVILQMHSVTHAKAPETVGVRAKLIRSKYVLTPKGENSTHVLVEIQTDPQGWLPAWLVNMIQKSWPMKTLLALDAQAKKDYVQPVALPEK